MPFEYAVRPFESRNTHGRVIIPSAPSFSTERATLTWGSQHAVPGALPTPHSLGVNIECCHEIITQNAAEMSPASIQLQGPGAATIPVKRTDVVLAKKAESNQCDDWLKNNSFVASGVKKAFDAMAGSIHASDASFKPAGSVDCKQRTTYKYDEPKPKPDETPPAGVV